MPLADITNTVSDPVTNKENGGKFDRQATRKRMWSAMNSKLAETNPSSPTTFKKLRMQVKTLSTEFNTSAQLQESGLKQENDSLKADVARLTAELAEVKATHANSSEKWDAEIKRLSAEIDTHKDVNITLQSEKSSLESVIADLRIQLATAQAAETSLLQRTTQEPSPMQIVEEEQKIETKMQDEEEEDKTLSLSSTAEMAPVVVEELKEPVEQEVAEVSVLEESSLDITRSALHSDIPLFTNKALLKSFHTQLPLIQTQKADWAQRVKAMQAINTMMTLEGGDLTHVEGYQASEKKLVKALCEQLGDLRSSIVKETCNVIVTMADVLADRFERALIKFLPTLFQSLFVSIAIISSSADQCTRTLLGMNNTIRVLPIFLEGVKDSHSIIRQRCTEYAQIYLKNSIEHGRSESKKQDELKLITSIVSTAVQDSDKNSRAAGRSLFLTMQGEWADASAALFETFESQTKRALSTAINKIKKPEKTHKRANTFTSTRTLGHAQRRSRSTKDVQMPL